MISLFKSSYRHTHIFFNFFNFCTNIHILRSYWNLFFRWILLALIFFPMYSCCYSSVRCCFGFVSVLRFGMTLNLTKISVDSKVTRKPTFSQIVGCVCCRFFSGSVPSMALFYFCAWKTNERTNETIRLEHLNFCPRNTITHSPKKIDVISII